MTILGADTILYGGDYNPEQWPEEVWARDMEMFASAGITTVTLNVFSWATLQPSDDEYDFDLLDRIVATVAEAGLKIVLATGTAAIPPWMAKRHPEVNRVEMQGQKMRHGGRHNACMSSPVFRAYSAALAGKLAQRYGSHPLLVAWHVSNEYGGFCWCDTCGVAFREWLKARYGTVEAVNAAWNSAFWSATFHSFDEIDPPNMLGNFTAWAHKPVLPGYSLDYRRFYGEQVLASYREEKAAIREHDPKTPVTTNFMGTFPDYDYFAWSDDLDIVSWDSYPAYDTTPAQVALRHDLMRAVGKQKPWMLMEQTPSRQNWAPYNSLKRPGQMRQLSWQAVARGADTVQFFQLRQSRGGCEKFHGAVIAASGSTKAREFREVAELGAELQRISGRVVGSTVEPGRVGLVFDWPSWWGIDYSAGPSRSLDYITEIERWYTELHRRAVPVDVVPAAGPFDGYDVLVAPCLYMLDDGATAALRSFVARGGRLLLTPMSAMAGESDLLFQGEAPVPLRDLAGVWIDETDALPPASTVSVLDATGRAVGAGEILADVVYPDPAAQVLLTYGGSDDVEVFYAGQPALTFTPSTGKGGVFYMATFPDVAAIAVVVDHLLDGLDVPQASLPDGVELSRRVHSDGRVLTFLINAGGKATTVEADVTGVDLTTGGQFDGATTLGPYGVAIVESIVETAGATVDGR